MTFHDVCNLLNKIPFHTLTNGDVVFSTNQTQNKKPRDTQFPLPVIAQCDWSYESVAWRDREMGRNGLAIPFIALFYDSS